MKAIKQQRAALSTWYGLLLLALFMSAGLVLAAPPAAATQSSLDQQLLSRAADAPIADVQNLIKSGAHINAQDRFGVTPLMQAVIGDNTAVVRMLLGAGADQNLRDLRGDTALDLARQLGRNNIERLLAGVAH